MCIYTGVLVLIFQSGSYTVASTHFRMHQIIQICAFCCVQYFLRVKIAKNIPTINSHYTILKFTKNS